MAPIYSKAVPPAQLRPEDAKKIAVRKAKPFLDALLQIVQASLETGAVVVSEVQGAGSELGRLVDKAVHGAAHLLQGLCCFDLQKFTRGPERPALQSQLPSFFVLGLLAMLYNAFVFAYMPAAGLALNSTESIFFHAFVFLTLASFTQAAKTDPGGIPEGPEWRSRDCPPRAASESKKFSEEPRWCRKSQAYKPDRAHFDRALNRVVLRMDHHCPWLGNTIGWANHKYFYLFLAYTNAACALLGVGVLELLINATLPALTTFLLIGTEAVTFLLSTILVPFLLFHTWLIARNMTTIEFCASFNKSDGDEGPPENPYDVGIFSNISSVLGSNPLIWWAPVGGPLGDGIHFHRRGGSQASSARQNAAENADPEAAHPAGLSGDDEEAYDSTVYAEQQAEEGCGGFLVWLDAAEFTDDLRVGCEFIGETVEDAALSFLSLCKGRNRHRKGSRHRVSNKSNIRLVPMLGGGESASDTASSCSRSSTRSSVEQGEAFFNM